MTSYCKKFRKATQVLVCKTICCQAESWTDSYLKSSLSLGEQSSLGLGGFTLKLKYNFHE